MLWWRKEMIGAHTLESIIDEAKEKLSEPLIIKERVYLDDFSDNDKLRFNRKLIWWKKF